MFRDFTKYEVFEDGRIWSYKSNKWLKPTPNKKGYYYIYLSDNEGKIKNYRLHRVIFEGVTGQPIPEGMDVNHINEDKSDNRFENLNLMTRKENVNWATRNERIGEANTNNPKRSKLVAQYDKKENLINIYPSLMEVHRQLGFNKGHISQCCNGKCKTYKGFIWRYITEKPLNHEGLFIT